MKQHRRNLAIFIVLLALLAACGNDEEPPPPTDPAPATMSPSVTPSPTAPPPTVTATRTPAASRVPATATAEPAGSAPGGDVVLGEPIWVERGEFAFRPAPGYPVDIFEETAFLVPDDAVPDRGPQLALVGGTLAAGETVSDVLDEFLSDLFDEQLELGSMEPITSGAHEGLAVSFRTIEDDVDVTGRLAALSDGRQVVVFFGGAEETRWDEETGPIFEAILDTITFSEPATSGADTPAGASQLAGNGQPRIACFGSGGRGLSCLDNAGEWQAYTRDDSPLGSDFIHALTVCDAEIYIVHSTGINAFDGAEWRQYPAGWGYGSPSDIACDGQGGFWVSHFEGVSHYDGRTWTTFDAGQLATGDQATNLVEGVAVAADGTVWVVTASSVAVYDGNEWVRFQQGAGFDHRYFFEGIVLDGEDRPWALHADGLLLYDDGRWLPYENDDFYTAESVAVGPDGQIWLGSFSNGLYAFDGSAWRSFAAATGGLPSDHVRALAVDQRGRVWAATGWGLGVLDAGEWTVYRMDNADLVDTDFLAVAVVGAGPPLPPPVEKAPGALTGRALLDGQALAGADVEICVQQLRYSFDEEIACADQPLFLSTTTDEAGNFVFADVPVGLYSIAVDTGDGWALAAGALGMGRGQVLVPPGETVNLGDLQIEREE